MRFLTRSLIGLFLLAATLGLFAFAGATVMSAIQTRMAEEPRDRPARERVFAANVVEIAPRTIVPELESFGEVQSRRTLELRASAAGAVVRLSENFETGGAVTEGEVLLEIDPRDAQAARDTAKADLAEAEADLADAERAVVIARDELAAAEEQSALRARALTRQRDLAERGVGTEAAVETAELNASSARQSELSRRQAEASAVARVDQARTTLQRREIALAEAERRLADTIVRAPFTGLLADVSLVPGRLVSDRERLGDIIDPEALEVAFRVSTAQYARLLSETGELIGAPVTAVIDVGGVDLQANGAISRESASVAEGQTGRLLFARLDDAPGFRPGDFVTVLVEEPALDGVARLPAAAVDAAGTVLVLGEEDRLEVAEVALLRRQGDDVIVRADELAGREVVAARTPLLGPGIRIRPLRPGAVAAPREDMVRLDPERRARLVAFIESNDRMPAEAKARTLTQLRNDEVPAEVVNRIEARMGS
ncbi:MAG: HlyD family efflux transporter periplasmic adaptor subunit [Paracoccaceae bacterium]|nr:HlyD family efflux transporter periplasmic adaptor subunit [Paracoccaceae bacterium]